MNRMEEVVLVCWLKNGGAIVVSRWYWVVIGGVSSLKKLFSSVVVIQGS